MQPKKNLKSSPTISKNSIESDHPIPRVDTPPSSPGYSFEITPTPIPESEITKIEKTEIVVIGSGTAGLVCANAAVENGAKVILISKSSGPVSRGGSNHAINTKLTRQLGIGYDVAKAFKKELSISGARIDLDKWYLFAKKSGEAMDWLIDKMEAAGYQTVIEQGFSDPDEINSAYPGSHSFIGKNIKIAGIGQQLVVDTLASLTQAAGGKIYYKTTAIQLVRENNNAGRVAAVIAKDADGKYVKYEGSKAIVLATGDFTKNREMMAKYCPEMLPFIKQGGVYAGDGHKMGLWVGAAWQKTVPNAPMVGGTVGPANLPGTFQGLLVNKNGVRFCNEDTASGPLAFIQIHQPDMQICAIWDSDYVNRMGPWYPWGSYFGGPQTTPEDVVAAWQADIKTGKIVKTNSIEKLAEQLGLDANTLRATVDRYNRYCDSGVDEDFFKRPALLIPIKKGPFYGQSTREFMFFGIVTGGLRCNIEMQVLDKDEQVIPGLYVVGTIVGDFFGNYYPFLLTGCNLGATCVTFGYLTGKKIARLYDI